MNFHQFILLLVAGLVGCVYSAPIYAHLPNNVDSSAELLTPRAKKNTFTIKHAGHAVIIKHKIDKLLHPGPSKSLFWSGTMHSDNGIGESVKKIAQDHARLHDKKTLKQDLDDAGIRIPTLKKNPHSKHIWEHASRVWAQRAHGKVEVVLGPNVREESVYKKIEKPTLMTNQAVTEVEEWNVGTGHKTQIKP